MAIQQEITLVTEMQEKFCRAFVESGGQRSLSAISAGYSEKTAPTIASQLMRNPRVMRRIGEIQRELVNGNLASKALHTLDDLMNNPRTPPAVRLGAARSALAAAGLDKPEIDRKANETKDLSDMDLSELSEFIKAGAERVARLRDPIDQSPSDAQIIEATEPG